jgi:hypothetical protein
MSQCTARATISVLPGRVPGPLTGLPVGLHVIWRCRPAQAWSAPRPAIWPGAPVRACLSSPDQVDGGCSEDQHEDAVDAQGCCGGGAEGAGGNSCGFGEVANARGQEDGRALGRRDAGREQPSKPGPAGKVQRESGNRGSLDYAWLEGRDPMGCDYTGYRAFLPAVGFRELTRNKLGWSRAVHKP